MKLEVSSSVFFRLSERKDVKTLSPQLRLDQLSGEKPAKNPKPEDLQEILKAPAKAIQDVFRQSDKKVVAG